MHTRRLSMGLIGLWLGLTIAMMLVATQNFRGVDRLLDNPGLQASRVLDLLGQEDARFLLRYQVSELNRFFFDAFGWMQIALAGLLTFSLLFATNGHRPTLVVCGALLMLIVAEKWYLTPEITYLGRLIDFVRADVPLPARSRFWNFHIAYSVLELVKILILLAFAVRLVMRRERHRRRFTEEEEFETESQPIR